MPGDYAKVNPDGTLQLLERGRVCTNTGGEKVYPEEVEEVPKRHPAVLRPTGQGLAPGARASSPNRRAPSRGARGRSWDTRRRFAPADGGTGGPGSGADGRGLKSRLAVPIQARTASRHGPWVPGTEEVQMSMSLDGLATGLDTSSIITKLMKLERQGQLRLQQRKDGINKTIAAYQGINSLFAGLKTAAADLAAPNAWKAFKATSTAPTAVTATATSDAMAASLTFTVDRLATAG